MIPKWEPAFFAPNVILAPDFGWKDIPLQDWLQKGVPWPVHESFLLGPDEIHTTLCVNLGYGIGAAIITGEELYDGAGGISGELGHCVVDRDGPLCKCGNSGCLEAVASGEAIARQLLSSCTTISNAVRGYFYGAFSYVLFEFRSQKARNRTLPDLPGRAPAVFP